MGHIRVNLPNTNNKLVGFGLANVDTFITCVGFRLANVDTFITCVGFRLANVDTIRTLTRHEHDPLTRIATHSKNHGTHRPLKLPLFQQ